METLSDDATGSSAETRPADVPTRLGRYLLLMPLGRGGMGEVWTAYDPKLDRKVAIKLLDPSRHTRVRKARFVREAQALAKLNHPNIVTVHDVDTYGEQLYMAMEYVPGQTLARWQLQDHGWREVLAVFDLAGRGLAAAHAAGITHRDFKPSNVLITDDGRVKVVDFGLAKHAPRSESDDDDALTSGAFEPPPGVVVPRAREVSALKRASAIMEVIESSSNERLTRVGRIVGTPAYMAPEQYVPHAREAGTYTDQFSFAASLYEALYGRLPFAGAILAAIATEVEEGHVREPPRDSPVPSWVLRVLQRALRYDPTERYPSMEALLAALADDPVLRRRRWAVRGASVGLLALAAFGVTSAIRSNAPPTCRGAPERLAEVWNDDARVRVRQGLLSTGRPFAADTAQRVTEGLDAHGRAWVEQHTAICEATRVHGEQSETLLDVRMTCLDRRRGELGALVGVLSEPEEDTVASAVAAVAGLRRPEPCATAQPGVESELPDEPVRRAEFLALQSRLDEANALLAAGRHAAARDVASVVVQRALDLDFARVRAEASVVRGSAHQKLREPAAAQEHLRRGITLASDVGDVRTEFRGWIGLLYVTGVLLDEPVRTADWQFAAEATLRRAGSPVDLEFELMLTLSAVMADMHRLDEATRYGLEALRIATRSEHTDPLELARPINNLGVAAAKQANWSLAEQRLRRSHELMLEALGPLHPEVAGQRMNLANVLVQRGKEATTPAEADAAYDEAERLYERSAAVREQNDGLSGKPLARTLSMLGLLQSSRGKVTQARRTYQRALALLRTQPEAHEELAAVLSNLGKLERTQQQFESAEVYYREALEILVAHVGESHPLVGTTRLQRCGMLVAAAQPRRAHVECAAALEIFEQTPETTRASCIDAHRLLAQAAQALEMTAEAEEHRRRATELEHAEQSASGSLRPRSLAPPAPDALGSPSPVPEGSPVP